MSEAFMHELTMRTSESPLIANFDKLREVELDEIDRVPSMKFVVEEGEEMFDLSKQAWIESADFLLEKIRESNDEFLSDDEVKLMRAVRKFGLIHKSSWILLHGDHMAPEYFHGIVKRMGSMKDEYAVGEAVSRSELESLLSSDNHAVEYKPITWESFLGRFEEVLNEKNLEEKELDFDLYHNLRKGLRHLGNIYQIKAVMSGDLDIEYVRAFQKINKVCSNMGDKLDEALVEEHDTGVKPDSFVVDDQIKNETREVLSSVLNSQLN